MVLVLQRTKKFEIYRASSQGSLFNIDIEIHHLCFMFLVYMLVTCKILTELSWKNGIDKVNLVLLITDFMVVECLDIYFLD